MIALGICINMCLMYIDVDIDKKESFLYTYMFFLILIFMALQVIQSTYRFLIGLVISIY